MKTLTPNEELNHGDCEWDLDSPTATTRHFHAMQIEAFADNADRRQVLRKYDPLSHINFIIPFQGFKI